MQPKLTVSTSERAQLVDITDQVAHIVAESGLMQGLCCLFVPHTTAGITLNENWDPTVKRDLLTALEGLVPWSLHYAHAEGNSAAHIKAALLGASACVPVQDSALVLGRRQGVYLAEFDGPRERVVVVTIIEDGVA